MSGRDVSREQVLSLAAMLLRDLPDQDLLDRMDAQRLRELLSDEDLVRLCAPRFPPKAPTQPHPPPSPKKAKRAPRAKASEDPEISDDDRQAVRDAFAGSARTMAQLRKASGLRLAVVDAVVSELVGDGDATVAGWMEDAPIYCLEPVRQLPLEAAS